MVGAEGISVGASVAVEASGMTAGPAMSSVASEISSVTSGFASPAAFDGFSVVGQAEQIAAQAWSQEDNSLQVNVLSGEVVAGYLGTYMSTVGSLEIGEQSLVQQGGQIAADSIDIEVLDQPSRSIAENVRGLANKLGLTPVVNEMDQVLEGEGDVLENPEIEDVPFDNGAEPTVEVAKGDQPIDDEEAFDTNNKDGLDEVVSEEKQNDSLDNGDEDDMQPKDETEDSEEEGENEDPKDENEQKDEEEKDEIPPKEPGFVEAIGAVGANENLAANIVQSGLRGVDAQQAYLQNAVISPALAQLGRTGEDGGVVAASQEIAYVGSGKEAAIAARRHRAIAVGFGVEVSEREVVEVFGGDPGGSTRRSPFGNTK